MITGQPQQHYAQLGGMDYTTPPHLLQPTRWRLQQNMRTVRQQLEEVPLNKVVGYMVPQSNRTLLALANIPAYRNYGSLVGFTENLVYHIGLTYSKPLLQDGASLVLNNDTHYRRWSTHVHNDHVFFVNDINPVQYTDGIVVKEVSADAPCGRYVMVFFDHLVIGAPTYVGRHEEGWIQWSHLANYAKWDSGTDSEADHYICSDYQREDDEVPGITGMALFRNLGLIFTYSTVYQMQYTGLPHIVHVDPLITDFGCGFYYGVAQLNDAVAWIDDKHKDFFIFKGNGPEAIGNAISKYFFDNVSDDPEYRQRTWCYVDHANREAVWVYVSNDSTDGAFDKAVAYNYENGAWSVRNVPDVHCFITAGFRANAAFDVKTSADAYTTETCADLVATEEFFGRLWGGANTMMLQEEEIVDTDEELLTRTEPTLETGDFHYGSLMQVKEVREIAINATYRSCAGIKTEVFARRFIDSALVWTDCGLWTEEIKEEYLTFKNRAGKVLRYRFTPQKTGVSVTTVIAAAASTMPAFTLRVELASLGEDVATVVVGGDSTKLYYLELFVRGSYEYSRFSSGAGNGFLQIGGMQMDMRQVILYLDVTAPVQSERYYLNRCVDIPGAFSTFTSYRILISVLGGSTLRLTMRKSTEILGYTIPEHIIPEHTVPGTFIPGYTIPAHTIPGTVIPGYVMTHELPVEALPGDPSTPIDPTLNPFTPFESGHPVVSYNITGVSAYWFYDPPTGAALEYAKGVAYRSALEQFADQRATYPNSFVITVLGPYVQQHFRGEGTPGDVHNAWADFNEGVWSQDHDFLQQPYWWEVYVILVVLRTLDTGELANPPVDEPLPPEFVGPDTIVPDTWVPDTVGPDIIIPAVVVPEEIVPPTTDETIVLTPGDQGGDVVVVQEIPDAPGSEFCQVDLVNTLVKDITETKGGNARGVIWRAFEANILGFGATK